MKTTTAYTLWVLVTAFATAPAYSQLAQSTFDSGADGWGSVFRQYAFANGCATCYFSNHIVMGMNSTPMPQPTGGNPGGFLQASDGMNLGDWYWRAPAKFLGDKSRAYGATLSFDLRSDLQSSAVTLADHDIILSGGGITLYGNFLIVTQAQTWQHFSIPLRETAGWSDLLTGLPATSNQMMAVLSSLTVLDIRGEFGGGPATDTGGIDNVVLGPLVSGPVQVLPPQFYPSVAITGTVGSLYLIEYTNKLSTDRWIPLTSIVLPSSPYIFCDLTATNDPTRFYRAAGLIPP